MTGSILFLIIALNFRNTNPFLTLFYLYTLPVAIHTTIVCLLAHFLQGPRSCILLWSMPMGLLMLGTTLASRTGFSSGSAWKYRLGNCVWKKYLRDPMWESRMLILPFIFQTSAHLQVLLELTALLIAWLMIDWVWLKTLWIVLTFTCKKRYRWLDYILSKSKNIFKKIYAS